MNGALRKSVIVMTRADLNTIGCSNPACTGDHRIEHLIRLVRDASTS